MVTNTPNAMIQFPTELIDMIWGKQINESIFERWSQPFEFSLDENSALIQYEGGPCSVLTTVQAHLLNELIFCKRCEHNWRCASKDEIDLHFLNALMKILQLLSLNKTDIYLGYFDQQDKKKYSIEQFHNQIRFSKCSSTIDLKQQMYSRLSMWKNPYGVLLFLYSCLMTKTIDLLKKEIDDETSLPLIDIAHGHGSQCLTNLFITGYATPHCFDGEKDISGLKLYGIRQQALIGFLSSLEIYRLLEVGWFLKNPQIPIWIIGSETHLTVIFSREQSLVQLDQLTPLQKVSQIFDKYDTEKNGFISRSVLDQVIQEMKGLSLVEMKLPLKDYEERLDPDNTQIILKSLFLNQFFPENHSEQHFTTPLNGKPFFLYHYNGLPRSNKDKKLRYASAQANISDFGYGNDIPSSAVTPVIPGSYLPITGVLRTKWATIELLWDEDVKPSLN